jgi:hypothetical protein
MTTDKPPPHTPLPVREVAQTVYESFVLDVWPSAAGIKDFGLDSAEHYGALQYAVRHHGVTVEDLDVALGYGPALTELVREGNPYHGIRFTTVWDTLIVPIRSWAAVTENLFTLGRLFATPEVLEVATQEQLTDALRRHAKRDWGLGDKSANDAALKDQEEILSRYQLEDGTEFYVRTWFTPPMTLVLLEWQLEL